MFDELFEQDCTLGLDKISEKYEHFILLGDLNFKMLNGPKSEKLKQLLYVHASIAIILMGKRELVALLNLSSWCLVMIEWLFLAVPWGCLRFVIVVLPDHTHLLFLIFRNILTYNDFISFWCKLNNLYLSQGSNLLLRIS